MRSRCAALLLLLVACVPAQTPPTDAQDKTPSDFVRFVKVGDGGHLDTAITTYQNKDGVTLTLFGAVHIADRALYEQLNDRFTRCDALLYELVAEADTRPQRGAAREGFNPVGMLQNGLKNSMELSFQLDAIDYAPANFVHADMTPREFQESMAERGESLLSIMWKMMAQGMQKQRADADAAADGAPQPFAGADLVKAFRSGEGRHLLRMMFASQMEEMENMAAGLDSSGKGSTLLEGRNEKCLRVLQEQIAAGRKNLGIYYGAAHLPHMEQRLVKDLGFAKVGHEWLVAWDCTPRPDRKYDRALVKLRSRANDELAVLIEAGRQFRAVQRPTSVPTVAEFAATLRDGKPWYPGPVQDPWGNDYVLRTRPVGTRWEAVSAGQDGVFRSEDDLVVVEARRPPRAAREAAGEVPDPRLQGARADVHMLRAAARRWREKHGAERLPTVVELHAGTDNGSPWVAGLERDVWGHEFRMQWRTQPDWEVRSAGPDGVFDNADDLVAVHDKNVVAAETAEQILDVAKAFKPERGAPTLEWLLAERNQGLPILPIDGNDPWGNAYVIRQSKDRMEVRSAGPDGVFDTADDVIVR
ncbi:MAG: hypothetical protein IPK26_14690 [Planctomycetes bacterium]|nr:hypothetical protein [Planctomycetota bacterium]